MSILFLAAILGGLIIIGGIALLVAIFFNNKN